VKIIHNSQFDLSFLMYRFPCRPKNIWDSMLVERVIFNGQNLGNALDEVAARRLGVLLNKETRESFIGYEGELTEEQCQYLEQDVIHLPAIMESQKKDIAERGLGKIVSLENGVAVPIAEMNIAGIGFDLTLWDETQKQIEDVLGALNQQLLDLLGDEFFIEVERTKKGEKYTQKIVLNDINLGSHAQLKVVLHKLGMKVQNTARPTLERYSEKSEFVAQLLEYKRWLKMSTWHWDDMINPATHRIHPDWNQIGTITGRLSSNIQQVPRPSPGRPNMRNLFRPKENHKFIIIDYGQQEPRILSFVSQDRKMIEAANEKDIYIAFARAIWNEEIEKKDPRRQLAKMGVLATTYGGSPDGLAPKLGITVDECFEFQQAVKRAFPTAYAWGNNQLRIAKSRGYVTSVLGRRAYFPDIRTKKDWQIANDARNYPIQMTGADLLKASTIRISNIIEEHKFDACVVLMYHDEVVLSVNKDHGEDLFVLATDAMQKVGSEMCPGVLFPVEGKLSDQWDH
ncbi:MAG: hypothetical protein GX416_00005, partial [Bacteroidales bacterium]|nr:hypothetical protein [Bacteroidales bacterium]